MSGSFKLRPRLDKGVLSKVRRVLVTLGQRPTRPRDEEHKDDMLSACITYFREVSKMSVIRRYRKKIRISKRVRTIASR